MLKTLLIPTPWEVASGDDRKSPVVQGDLSGTWAYRNVMEGTPFLSFSGPDGGRG